MGMLFTVIKAVQADGGEGPRHGGNQSGQQRDQQGDIDALHDNPVLEQLPVPVQGKTLPHRAAVPGVKREDNQQKDGRVQKEEHQADEKPAAKARLLFHSITACSSPSPKWFITTIHTTTTIIMTMEMAAPRWGL